MNTQCNAIEFIYCGCGCQKTRSKYLIIDGIPSKWHPRQFINGHQNRKSLLFTEFVYCACGCGLTRPKRNIHRQKRLYIPGHQRIGREVSEHTRKKQSQKLSGKKNPMFGRSGESAPSWKGDNVGLYALHRYVEKRFLKTKFCQLCEQVPPVHLANITGIYNRELKNWAWFCRKCHLKFDNVHERAKITTRLKKSKLLVPFEEWTE